MFYDCDWMRQPFDVPSEKTLHISYCDQDELTKLSITGSPQVAFWNGDVWGFRLNVRKEYMIMTEVAVGVMVKFAACDRRVSAFPVSTHAKSEYRAHLAKPRTI